MNIIVTPRLLLRPLADTDLAEFIQLYEPLATGYNKELDELFAIFTSEFRQQGWGVFAVIDRREKKFIGTCGLCLAPVSRAVELIVSFLPEAQGKGYATEAAKQIVQKAFSEWGISHIIATAALENTPAIKVMKKIGMSPSVELPLEFETTYEIRLEQQQPPMRPFRQSVVEEYEYITA